MSYHQNLQRAFLQRSSDGTQMISTSIVTLRMDERFGHYNLCDVSIKVAYLGWRVETIYTKTQLVSSSSSVSTHSFDLRASTYQRTSQSEP